MKKTILAVAISAASFGALATELPTPDQKIDILEEILVSKGAVITENPSGSLKTLTIQGHTVVFDTVSGHYMVDGGEFQKIDKQHLDTIKDAGRAEVIKYFSQVGTPDPILDINPIDVGVPSHKLPTMEEKVAALETVLVNNGATINTSPDGTLKTVSVIRDGELHTVTIDTVSGHYMYNGETTKITGENKDTIIRKAVEKTGLVGGIDPIDVVIGPIDGQPLDREGNIDQFNKYLSNQGEGNAQVVTQKDGTKTLSYTDPVSGETRHLNLSEMTPEQLKVVKDGMVAYHEANQPVAPTPIDVIIGPIDGQPLDREGNIDQFNKYLSNQGEGNAQIVTQKDGTKTLSYTDPVSGETRHLNLSEMTPEQLKVVKDGMVAYHEANQPVVPAPIEGEKPVPSEGQKIVEGLKKAADGIRDAEKDWGENSTGAIVEYSQSVQAQTQSQIDELYALGNQNATDINTLFNEVDRLDSKIDGVAAMSQASLAARPYLSTNQTSSVGVGIGGAGSEAAFALGYAHRMTENWTANANVAVNTGDSAEASYGAGVSYAW